VLSFRLLLELLEALAWEVGIILSLALHSRI